MDFSHLKSTIDVDEKSRTLIENTIVISGRTSDRISLDRDFRSYKEKYEQVDEELKQTTTLLVGSKLWAEKLESDLCELREKVALLEQQNCQNLAKNEQL